MRLPLVRDGVGGSEGEDGPYVAGQARPELRRRGCAWPGHGLHGDAQVQRGYTVTNESMRGPADKGCATPADVRRICFCLPVHWTATGWDTDNTKSKVREFRYNPRNTMLSLRMMYHIPTGENKLTDAIFTAINHVQQHNWSKTLRKQANKIGCANSANHREETIINPWEQLRFGNQKFWFRHKVIIETHDYPHIT
jgi:hypothetical protein